MATMKKAAKTKKAVQDKVINTRTMPITDHLILQYHVAIDEIDAGDVETARARVSTINAGCKAISERNRTAEIMRRLGALRSARRVVNVPDDDVIQPKLGAGDGKE